MMRRADHERGHVQNAKRNGDRVAGRWRHVQAGGVEEPSRAVAAEHADDRAEDAGSVASTMNRATIHKRGVPMASMVPISRVRSNMAISSVFTLAISTMKNTMTPMKRKIPLNSVRTCL